jgi:Magnesium chelatase, subunit ChlI
MLARRLTTILPAMTLAEAIETTRFHSVAGLTGDRTALVTTRPCRAPHQTSSEAALIGGGHVPRCGQACVLLLISACWADEDIAEGSPFLTAVSIDASVRVTQLADRSSRAGSSSPKMITSPASPWAQRQRGWSASRWVDMLAATYAPQDERGKGYPWVCMP